MPLQIEFPFVLPKGYVDKKGNLHREGVMRLAKVSDEILPLKDPRVQQNPSYLIVIILSRVIVSLGTLKTVSTQTIEGLYSSDLAYLQELYHRINRTSNTEMLITCPKCHHEFNYVFQRGKDNKQEI